MSMDIFRRTRYAFFRLALLYLLVVLPGVEAQELRAAGAKSAVNVQLSWKYQFEFAPFIAALEKGYYREAGLEVAVREWAPGIDVLKEVGEGRADFATTNSSLVVAQASDPSLVALAALMQHSAVGLLTKRQTGIATAADLAGKRVLTTAATKDEILAFLASAAVSRERIELLADVGDARLALEDGRVDAIAFFVGDAAYRSPIESGDYVLLRPRTAGVDFYGNVLFSSTRLLEAQPERVRAFRAATLRGLDYAVSHPEEMVDVILARYNSQRRTRDELLYEAQQIGALMRPEGGETGAMNAARWRQVGERYAGLGKIPAGSDLLGLIYDPQAGAVNPLLLSLLAGVLLGLALVAWALRRFVRQR